jgi:hypothetical protein
MGNLTGLEIAGATDDLQRLSHPRSGMWLFAPQGLAPVPTGTRRPVLPAAASGCSRMAMVLT